VSRPSSKAFFYILEPCSSVPIEKNIFSPLTQWNLDIASHNIAVYTIIILVFIIFTMPNVWFSINIENRWHNNMFLLHSIKILLLSEIKWFSFEVIYKFLKARH
jgi:hypothetical protein